MRCQLNLSTKIVAPDCDWRRSQRLRYEVELLCRQLPSEKITVDLDGIKIGDSIHISAIPLPDGVEPTITDRDFTVATIASPGGGVKNEDEEGEDAEDDESGSEDEPSED